MIYPLVREMAADGAPTRVSVAVACGLLGFSEQAYYPRRILVEELPVRSVDREFDAAQVGGKTVRAGDSAGSQ